MFAFTLIASLCLTCCRAEANAFMGLSACAVSGRRVLPDHLIWFQPAQPETYSGTLDSLEHEHFPLPLSPNSCKYKTRYFITQTLGKICCRLLHSSIQSLTSLALRQGAVLWTVAPGKKSCQPDVRTPLPKPAGGVAQQQDSRAAGPQQELLPCQKRSSGDHSTAGKAKKSGGANKPLHLHASAGSVFSPSKSETKSFFSLLFKEILFLLLAPSLSVRYTACMWLSDTTGCISGGFFRSKICWQAQPEVKLLHEPCYFRSTCWREYQPLLPACSRTHGTSGFLLSSPRLFPSLLSATPKGQEGM